MKSLSKQGEPEVYQYTELPKPFRVQVIQIWREALGLYISRRDHDRNEAWDFVHDTLSREMGLFTLVDISDNIQRKCEYFLLNSDVTGALDIIELSFKQIDGYVRDQGWMHSDRYEVTQDPDDAINELNHRFREHSIGYQFEGGELIRVDSQYLHSEAVKPAIALLNEDAFRGPSEEFLKAHEHYRKGESKEAINWALKAFESAMKAICDAQKWSYASGSTAKPLLDVLFEKGLIPQEMQSHFQALRSTLEAGLPTLRNKSSSSHGQGAEPKEVPDYMAAYALHLAATNIVFLVEAHKAQR